MQQVAALQEAGLLQVMPVGSGGKFGPAAHAENEVTTNETYCYNIKSHIHKSYKKMECGKYVDCLIYEQNYLHEIHPLTLAPL